jgi:choline dehydrogenase-like flavoprotein
MPRQLDLNDSSLVVIIGSGAGGGTLGNELPQKGIRTLILEAGPRIEREQHVDDERQSFAQLTWLDKRTTSGSWEVAKLYPNFPTWTCKVGCHTRIGRIPVIRFSIATWSSFLAPSLNNFSG